ncbi:MAG: molybdopterin-binding protein [Nevskiaceae bacterium]|jgi:molybdenum cofactor cytidylyltransferase|nr:molybdopterin-binding protein [Nevskiaceae bacterium]
MKFGAVRTDEAAGCVLAHSIKLPGGALRKGTALDADALMRLAQAGIDSVIVAQLDDADVGENEAAACIALVLAGEDVEVGLASTGRVNLHAKTGGVLQLDASRVSAANSIDEGLTIATLPPDVPVRAGQMVATIKIIPYAVSGDALLAVMERLQGLKPALAVARWEGIRARLVMTKLESTAAPVLTKMRRAVLQRLTPLGAVLDGEEAVTHDPQAIASALIAASRQTPAPDLLLVSGIVATVDRHDVVPEGIVQAGGRVLHAGMPVDPGNLLLLAELPGIEGQAVPVIGIPTCARSLKLNGFDFVLRRFAARLPVASAHIMRMGVGGLLTEIQSRPMPREAGDRDFKADNKGEQE